MTIFLLDNQQIVGFFHFTLFESLTFPRKAFFKNFSYMFLNPNIFFQIWIIIVLIY